MGVADRVRNERKALRKRAYMMGWDEGHSHWKIRGLGPVDPGRNPMRFGYSCAWLYPELSPLAGLKYFETYIWPDTSLTRLKWSSELEAEMVRTQHRNLQRRRRRWK